MATQAQTVANAHTLVDAPSTAIAQDRWTRRAAFVVGICFLVYIFDIYELTTFQVALPAIIVEFNITRLDAGALTLLTGWVGRFAGLILVPFADIYGRRAVLAAGVFGYSIFTGFTGLTQTWLQFSIATVATRFPVTAANFPSSIMATEAAPASGRALAQGLQASGYSVGFVLVALASVVLLPTLGWRYMYFLGIVPAVLVVLILRHMPESRHFSEVKASKQAEGKSSSVLRSYWSVLRRYPKETSKGAFVTATYGFWAGFGVWVTLYLSTERQLGPATTGTWLAIWWFFAIFATIAGGWLAQRFGRRRTNVTIVLISVPVFATYGLLEDPTALFIGGLLLCSLFLAPFGQGTWGAVQELFPTEVRATGFAAANFIGGTIASFYALIPGVMPSVAASFPIFAAGYALLAVAFYILKETVHEGLTQRVGERAGSGHPA